MKSYSIQGRDLLPQIIVVFPEGEVDSVPSVLGAIREFSRIGYQVNVFGRECDGFLRPAPSEGIKYFWHRPLKNCAKWLDIIARGLYWLVAFMRVRYQGCVTCVIGVDQSGIIWGRWLNCVLRAPLVYWSLEIQPRDELCTRREHRYKALEQNAARMVSVLIIQDREREELLRSAAVDIPGVPTVHIPNSSEGEAAKRRSRYLHTSFGIPDNKRIVLHSGSVAEWACSLELAESSNYWPDDWVLVFHSCRTMRRDQYTALVQKASCPGRVYFSQEPLPSDRYAELVRSADIGVAFYREKVGSPYTQKNIRHMGFSSGKAASYLREGIPLIYAGSGLFDNTLQEYRCAERVQNPRETIEAISKLLTDYEVRCAAAVHCFNAILRIDGCFPRLLDALAGVHRGR